MVILAHCCTPHEKEHILEKAREIADGLLATNPHHQLHQVEEGCRGGRGYVTPEHDPQSNYDNRVGQARMRHYITCLSEGMKRSMVKPVDYGKVQEVAQEKTKTQQSS